MRVLQILLVLCLIYSGSYAKKHGARHEEKRIPARLEENVETRSSRTDRLESRITGDRQHALQNPCMKVRCKSGKECALDERNVPRCVCIQECPDELTIEDAVCGTDNHTYESECAFRRLKCLGSPDRSIRKKLKRLKVCYLGPCKAMTQCKKSEFLVYPTRMRSWLKNIFLQMYDTPEEDGGLNEKERYHGRKVYVEREKLQDFEEGGLHDLMEQEFQKFYQIYKYPIHWKFADLDRKPKDKQLTKRELEPLRAPLIPLEHCAKPFFKRADKNKDKKISLEEWGLALGLKTEDIDPRLVF